MYLFRPLKILKKNNLRRKNIIISFFELLTHHLLAKAITYDERSYASFERVTSQKVWKPLL